MSTKDQVQRFKPVALAKNATQSCSDSLRAKILREEWPDGYRLPPERELAEELGVSRLTLRQALGQLTAERLLSVRQGSGYVVRPWRRDGGPGLFGPVIELVRNQNQRMQVLKDLLDVRRHIAQAAFTRLCETGVSELHYARIASAVHNFALQAAEGADPEQLSRAELLVFQTVADATDSAVYQLCLNPIATVLQSLPELIDVVFRDPSLNIGIYQVMLAWLKAPVMSAVPLLMAEIEKNDHETLSLMAEVKPGRAVKKRSKNE